MLAGEFAVNARVLATFLEQRDPISVFLVTSTARRPKQTLGRVRHAVLSWIKARLHMGRALPATAATPNANQK
jgi:hypothetical protein